MQQLIIREAGREDLNGLLRLYTHLHDNPLPEQTQKLGLVWAGILRDPNHHILIGSINFEIICSCVLLIVPNLTHGQRPYALIENVVTHAGHRGCGYATEVLAYAEAMAKRENCYKIMLLTGSREESTLSFYRRAGYSSEDKTGFVRWL